VEQPKSKDPQKELEIALAELEERVDRLRASYEQYFMGYEKIEPGVQRKDVDRRFTLLRKQQIRNTALRFRFNVVTQKFNTYSMYWTRICRQIEEGTYKRHIAKAAKRFGGQAQNKREQDWSIDVELGDFDDMDMDAVLAEADAAAEAYGRNGLNADTIPPGARTEPPPSPSFDTSFAMGGGRETVGSEPLGYAMPIPQPPGGGRVSRPAPLPAGWKPRVLLRRRDGEAPPPSTPQPVHRARDPITPVAPFQPQPLPRTPAPSTGRIDAARGPAPSTGRIATPATPASPTTPQPVPRAPGSINRIATGSPQPYRPAALPPSANRLPVAPAPTSSPRTPAAPMSPPFGNTPPGAKVVPAARPPASSPTPPDSEQPRPSRRPPPPLPSQGKKP
jgi:hypothetical protein